MLSPSMMGPVRLRVCVTCHQSLSLRLTLTVLKVVASELSWTRVLPRPPSILSGSLDVWL